jgi:hypothetical protein
MLIGAGLSNREVAARLTISVRTVESHIYNAMAKTGTGGREHLAALLPWRRPVGESFPLAEQLTTSATRRPLSMRQPSQRDLGPLLASPLRGISIDPGKSAAH